MAATSETEEKSELFLDLWVQAQDGTDQYPPHSVYQLVSSEISQMGKTTYALRVAEVVLERLKGRRFDWKANTHFEYAPFMRRRTELYKSGQEWDFQVLDEPQRVAGHRDFWTVQNKTFAEELQTNNYRHEHALLPLPHGHVIDPSVWGILTSHTVITSVGHATIYAQKRLQLERKWEERTPKLCWITFEKPSFWAGFCKMRDDYNDKRAELNIARTEQEQQEAEKLPASKSVDSLEQEIMDNPQAYIGKDERISFTRVLTAQPKGYPHSRVQEATARANKRLADKRALERAEREGS